MVKKLPIINSCVSSAEILKALYRAPDRRSLTLFAETLTLAMPAKNVLLTNSGISAFYIILKALKNISGRSEVILPAYTAGSLIVAIRKAGLKPILCDISLEDFNLNENYLADTISSKTLAVVGVHMFGINMKHIASLKNSIPKDVFLIEDCAQSMGSKTADRESGTFSDVSFFSFNRGKNLPLSAGGCIITDNEIIARGVKNELAEIKAQRAFSWFGDLLKTSAFSLAGNPLFYGLGYPVISRFKEVAAPKDFLLKEMSAFAAGLGMEVIKRKEEFFSKRYKNGLAIIAGLKETEKILLPKIPEFTRYVFNRFPVVFKQTRVRIKAQRHLAACGIETSRMYLRPLHYMFDLGYARKDFPSAVYLAENLLTLPTHPGVMETDLIQMIEGIQWAAR